MSKANKNRITDIFKEHFDNSIYCTMLNGSDFGVQTRRRLYWTTWSVNIDDIKCEQVWEDVLEPIEKCVNYRVSDKILTLGNQLIYNRKTDFSLYVKNNNFIFDATIKNKQTRWQVGFHSDTINTSCNYNYPIGKSRSIIRQDSITNCLVDRRLDNELLFRRFTPIERERLFWLPDGWVSELCSKTRSSLLLGNTVIVRVIEHILNYLILK